MVYSDLEFGINMVKKRSSINNMNTISTLSEKSLVENCINRNRKSQKELFERLSPEMFSICNHFAKNQVDAEEILQYGFVKLFNTIHEFKGDETLEGWASKLFVYIARKFTKRNKVKIDLNPAIKDMVTKEHIKAAGDIYETIYSKTMGKLNKEHSSAFKLYAVGGYAVEETIDKPAVAEGAEIKPTNKPVIRVVQNNATKSDLANLQYTVQKGDERRLNKDGVLRVYNRQVPIDIPVTRLLGKWKKEHVGVTLIYKNFRWQIEGESSFDINNYNSNANSSLSIRQLLKFV